MRTSVISHLPAPAPREFIVIALDAESQELLREQVPAPKVKARIHAFGTFASWVAVVRVKSEPLAATG